MNFIDEIKWRGMLHDMMPGTEEQLAKELTTAYLGIDPTADSLHIGHLCGVMMLRHFQRCGHKPIALIGGATGMIGDPSGKSAERNLLGEETLRHNQTCIQKQLEKFLDFHSDAPNAAEMVNNYDWMKDFTFLDFAQCRQTDNGQLYDGKRFGEKTFEWRIFQRYEFYRIYLPIAARLRFCTSLRNEKLQNQMGGSDQWGNITTGTELIRRMNGGEALH